MGEKEREKRGGFDMSVKERKRERGTFLIAGQTYQ